MCFIKLIDFILNYLLAGNCNTPSKVGLLNIGDPYSSTP